MSEFTTSGSVYIELNDASVSQARDDLEAGLESVQVDVDAVPNRRRFQDRIERTAANANAVVEPDVDDSSIGSVPLDADMARADGGLGAGVIDDAAIVDELNEQSDYLEAILDEIEGGGAGGGGGGGGGLPGGGIAAGLGIRGLLGGTGLAGSGLAGTAGIATAGLLGIAGVEYGGRYLSDMTNDFSDFVIGSGGGMVPPSMFPRWFDDGTGGDNRTNSESMTFNEAVNSVVSQALGGGFDGPLATGEPINQGQPADTGSTARTDPTYGGGYIPGAQDATPRREDVVGQGGYIPGATEGSAFASAASAGSTDKGPWAEPYMADPTGRETIGVGGAATGTVTLGGGGGAPSPRNRDVVGGAITGTSTLGASAAGTTSAGGTKTEANVPINVTVRQEGPNTDRVVDEVLRKAEPKLKSELKRWLKQDGTTTISNEQQSRYTEGF